MNNLQHIVKDNARFAMHMAVELCEQGDFDSVPEAFRWLNQETVGNYTRWHELFGTPERAARTLLYVIACKDSRSWVACEECPILGGCAVRIEGHDALLEWLRGDA